MKIAIIGGGFTGLSCALKLLEGGHQVTVFEREGQVGGLAAGFKEAGWDWYLEKAYHHFFTNDQVGLSLAKKLNQPIIVTRPQTNVLINGHITSLDSPFTLLSFPYLGLVDKLRMGGVTAYLKMTKNYQGMVGIKALAWVRIYMGKKVTKMIWEPLFAGKFGGFAEDISLTWFWARIKKRSTSLAYPEGGYQQFLIKISEQVTKLGGQINLNSTVIAIKSGKSCQVKTAQGNLNFDKVIITTPTSVFTKIVPNLPKNYLNKVSSIPHLTALNLVLVLPKKFFDSTYWLNITDQDYPFLIMAEQTNFMPAQHYNNQHIIYVGNYLPEDHPYLKMTAQQLLDIYKPYIKQINPHYNLKPIRLYLFKDPHAQPVVTTDYLKFIPDFKTPLPNVYLANLDMVYPWDRGVNYAIELGQKVAKLIP